MTINELLQKGIVLAGYIEVVQHAKETDPVILAKTHNDRVLFRNLLLEPLSKHINEPWADKPIKYMYSPFGYNGLTIEVSFRRNHETA